MHTSPLYLPGTLSPALSEVTPPENFSSEGSFGEGFAFVGFTYPGHFLAFAEASTGEPKFVTWLLTQVTAPPPANTAIESGIEAPPVPGTALPEHPLRVMVPLPTDPLIEVQVPFPCGPLLAEAGIAESAAIPEAASATAVTEIPTLRNRCIYIPDFH